MVKLLHLRQYLFSLQVVEFLISCNVNGKIVLNSVENFKKVQNDRESDAYKKLFHEMYEYYGDEFFKPRVIDLDAYDFNYDEVPLNEQDIPNFQSGYNQIDTSSSPVTKFNPLCPDIPSSFTEKYVKNKCNAKICQSDGECTHLKRRDDLQSNYPQFSCCFNGCVSTCLQKVDPPKAFDWTEDIYDKDKIKVTQTVRDVQPKSITTSEDDTIATDTIILPGGCVITPRQFEELRLFRKYNHVEECTCEDGEVVCKVNSRHLDSS